MGDGERLDRWEMVDFDETDDAEPLRVGVAGLGAGSWLVMRVHDGKEILWRVYVGNVPAT